MKYTVKNISGKVQTLPKSLSEMTVFLPPNNWGIGETDEVDGAAISFYQNHTDAWLILSSTVPAATLAAGMSKSEASPGIQNTVLNFVNVSVSMVDHTTAGSQGSLELTDLPKGLINFLGCSSNLTISRVGTNIAATAAVVGAIGTAVAAITDATLSGTEANILPSTASPLTAGAGVTKGVSTGVSIVDGTTTAQKAYLNFAIPDADSAGNDTLVVNGSVTICWLQMGGN